MNVPTNRRRLLPAAIAVVALCIPLTGLHPVSRAVAQETRPNVLVIVTDDQRGGLSVMPETRHRIGVRGVRFPNAFATTPLCCPSRASIFTGQYAHNHGVKTNGLGSRLDTSTTIQRYLSDAGYMNGLIGKYLNSWNVENPPPHFDYFALSDNGSKKPRYYDSVWNVNGAFRTVEGYSTDYMTRKGKQFLRLADSTDDERPWFLYMAPNAPHYPYTPSETYARAKVPEWSGNPAVFEQDKSDKPLFVQNASASYSHGYWARKKQFRTLMSVDDLVAGVLDKLAKLHESRNTLVLFISDNGYAWSEHGLKGKSVPYLQVTKVPFMLRWPLGAPYRTFDDRLVANIDIAPTIASATGVDDEVEHTMDGRSLLDETWVRDRLLLESWGIHWASTVTPEYQYTEYYDDFDQVEFREYYDLSADPWQLTNLLEDADLTNTPPELPAIQARLATDKSCSGNSCP